MPTALDNFFMTIKNKRRAKAGGHGNAYADPMPATLSKTVAIGRDKDIDKHHGQDGGRELLEGIIHNFREGEYSDSDFDGMVPQTLAAYLLEIGKPYNWERNKDWLREILSGPADWLFIFHPDINHAFQRVKTGSKIDKESFSKAYKGNKGAPTYLETCILIDGGFDTVESAESYQTELSRNWQRKGKRQTEAASSSVQPAMKNA